MTDWLSPPEIEAVLLSLKVAFWATLVSLPFGIATGFVLARYEFPGKQLLNGLVHLPLILPPVVTGFILLKLFGTQGPIGGVLQELGIVIAFSGQELLLRQQSWRSL
jgi:molybdate transport system permease protein